MKRPRIIVNVAMTADGKIDSVSRTGAPISSQADKTRVDRFRASVDAIMVGGRTLAGEDPRLTVKSPLLRAERVKNGLPENPAKVGVITEIPLTRDFVNINRTSSSGASSKTTLPFENFLTSGSAKVFIFTTRCNQPDLLAAMEKTGAQIQVLGEDRVDLTAVFQHLLERGIRTVLVEGGGTLIAELFHLDLVDELTIYMAPILFGGSTSPTLADGPGFIPGQIPHMKLLSVKPEEDQGGIFIHYLVEHKE